MPSRAVVSQELAQLLGLLAHPDRVRIVEELRHQERSVTELQQALGTSHSRVSQHLGLLRAHRLVHDRRDGRVHYYRLTDARLAAWLVEGLVFLDAEARVHEGIHHAIEEVRGIWGSGQPPPTKASQNAGSSPKATKPKSRSQRTQQA